MAAALNTLNRFVNRFELLSEEVAPAPVPAPVAEKPVVVETAQKETQRFHRNHDNRGSERGSNRHHNHGTRPGHHNLASDRAQNDAVASGLEAAPRKREYDHHVPANNARRGMKKGGAGGHNWGSNTVVEEVVKDEESGVAAAVETVVEEVAVEEVAAPVEEVDTTITLDEYLKQKEASRVADDVERQTRRAGEDVNEEDFQSASEYVAKNDESDILGVVAATNKRNGASKVKAVSDKKKMSIDEFVSNSVAGAPARGGRGGRGRGQRGGHNHRQVVNVNDAQAFPALGKK